MNSHKVKGRFEGWRNISDRAEAKYSRLHGRHWGSSASGLYLIWLCHIPAAALLTDLITSARINSESSRSAPTAACCLKYKFIFNRSRVKWHQTVMSWAGSRAKHCVDFQNKVIRAKVWLTLCQNYLQHWAAHSEIQVKPSFCLALQDPELHYFTSI